MLWTTALFVMPGFAQVEAPRKRSVPAYPGALRGVVPPDLEVRCRADVTLNARGVPTTVAVEQCPGPYAASADAALHRWRWAPGEPREVQVALEFIQHARVPVQRIAANPGEMQFVAVEHLPSGRGTLADAGSCLPVRAEASNVLAIEVCEAAHDEGRVTCELWADASGNQLTFKEVHCSLHSEGAEVRSIQGTWPADDPLALVRTGVGQVDWAMLTSPPPAHPSFDGFGVYRPADAITVRDADQRCLPTDADLPPVVPRSACETWGANL